MGFEDFATSMQMRDLITKLVSNAIDTLRPKYRYATVQSIDAAHFKCTVIQNGDTNAVIVNYGSVYPGPVGRIVRIEGIGTDKFVADALGPDGSVPLYTKDGPGGQQMFSRDNVVWQTTVPAAVPYLRPTYVNGFGDYSSGLSLFHDGSYMKTSQGIVSLAGLISAAAIGTTQTFTLPVGYRPDNDLMFPVMANNAFGILRISGSTGLVTLPVGSPGFVSLAGIMFPAAGVATWTPVAAAGSAGQGVFATGWSSYHTLDSSFGPLAYWRDPLGRVWQNGMPRQNTPSTLVADTKTHTLPFRKNLMSHYPASGNSVYGNIHLIDNGAGTDVYAKSGTVTNWITMTRLMYPDDSIRSDWSINDQYLNGWTKYPGASYPERRHMWFADGILVQDGLIGGGTVATGNTGISRLAPSGALPDIENGRNSNMSGTELFLIAANLAIARIGIVGLGFSQAVGPYGWEENTGSSTWRSYAGVNYVVGG